MRWQFPENPDPKSFSALAAEFLLWARAEFSFSRESVEKYGDCLKQIWGLVGEKPIGQFSKTDLLRLKTVWLNGCPIGHIKTILGHERLETTCRYYLGLDQRAAKAAHQKYLEYGTGENVA
jgi:hypothetical protein